MASVKRLQVGQKVSMIELESGCTLTVVGDEQPGSTVVEVAPDFVVIEDAVAEVKTRIPSYLVKTVTAPEPPVVEEPVVETAPQVAAPVYEEEPEETEATVPLVEAAPEVAMPMVEAAPEVAVPPIQVSEAA